MAKLDFYRSTATKILRGQYAGAEDGIPIITDTTDPGDLFLDGGDRNSMRTGHDPAQYRPDFNTAPLQMKTIPEGEWKARYDEQEREESSLEHLYLKKWDGPCLDQNGQGYCWAYSSGAAVMMNRLSMRLPFVRLNPHAVASKIKNGRDEGGWCGLSLQFLRDFGCPEEGSGPNQWPTHGYGRSLNSRWDQAEFLNAAAGRKVTDDWYDLGKPAYGQELTRLQHATCLFNNCAAPSDFNWWGHSVCALRYVLVESGSWGLLILNSWKGWGRRGLAVLQGSKARPDGAVSVVASMAA